MILLEAKKLNTPAALGGGKKESRDYNICLETSLLSSVNTILQLLINVAFFFFFLFLDEIESM